MELSDNTGRGLQMEIFNFNHPLRLKYRLKSSDNKSSRFYTFQEMKKKTMSDIVMTLEIISKNRCNFIKFK